MNKKALIIIQSLLVFAFTSCNNSPPTSQLGETTPTFTIAISTTIGFSGEHASSITLPPPNMSGINTQSKFFGTGADPEIITLGPVNSIHPELQPYPGKHSIDLNIVTRAPILAPIDMIMIGFDNRNAEFRTFTDGSRSMPFDDLELCFESVSEDWPGLIICAYHLSTSPLLTGHNVNENCRDVEEWIGTWQTEGRIFYEYSERISSQNEENSPCGGLFAKLVERGEVIGYAGNVNGNPLASFRFKVPDQSENEQVQLGDKNLHWVQPDSFFYWMCYSPETKFYAGVLSYPFECGGYHVSELVRNPDFKYSVSD